VAILFPCGPARLQEGGNLSEDEEDSDDNLYDEVDETEYNKIRASRLDGDDFIVDDEGGVDHGYM